MYNCANRWAQRLSLFFYWASIFKKLFAFIKLFAWNNLKNWSIKSIESSKCSKKSAKAPMASSTKRSIKKRKRFSPSKRSSMLSKISSMPKEHTENLTISYSQNTLPSSDLTTFYLWEEKEVPSNPQLHVWPLLLKKLEGVTQTNWLKILIHSRGMYTQFFNMLKLI